MSKDKVFIFDTTLRDGEQALRSSLTVKEKIQIAHQLAELKVDVIEAGFPISSPGDFESVKTIGQEIKGPVICGLARAVEKDIKAVADALKKSENFRIHTFLATSKIHVQKKLKKDYDEVIAMSVKAVKYAKKFTNNIEFSCEDAGRTDIEMLYRIIESVIDAGATTVNVPDTVGYTVPNEFGGIIHNIFNNVPNIDKSIISVHCHNDLGMAVANSITAVQHGARQIECTINGIGERAGNCSLEEVVMIMKTRNSLLKTDTNIKTKEITKASRLVSRLCNMPVQANKSIVGANAFAHSSGIHQDGVLKAQNTYEIMKPETVGLAENILNLTSRSGRHVIKHRLASLGYKEGSYDMDNVYSMFVELADKKGTVYNDDLESLMETGSVEESDIFSLDYLNVTSGSGVVPTATVEMTFDNKSFREAATGDGPVNATYNTIDRITGLSIKLIDYTITSKSGSHEAMGEVNIIVESGTRRFHGVGASTDIIEASAMAYINIANKIKRMERIESKKLKSKKKS